jgi:hypothetical protein
LNKSPSDKVGAVHYPDHLTTLARVMASWFVRLDNNFFDLDDLAYMRSRTDVEQTSMIRFSDEFLEIPLTNPSLAAVPKQVIATRHTTVDETMLPWNGYGVCCPENSQRTILERGVAAFNAWKEPFFRQFKAAGANYGIAGEFLDWFFTTKSE